MEFLGFVAILFAGLVLISAVTNLLRDPDLIRALSDYSPWIAAYSEGLFWIATAVLSIGLGSIILKIKQNDVETGRNSMEVGGHVVVAALQAVLVILVVVSVSYLAGIVWIAAVET